MIGHAAIGIASDIAISQAQKAVARKLERDVKLKERVTGLMHGFQESKEKFGRFLERRGISPRGRAIVGSVTPEPSQVGSQSQAATTSTALSPQESVKNKEVASGSNDPAPGDSPAPRALTPGPTCRLTDGAQLPEGSTVKQLIEVFSRGRL